MLLEEIDVFWVDDVFAGVVDGFEGVVGFDAIYEYNNFKIKFY
jgi:hypothetical protein